MGEDKQLYELWVKANKAYSGNDLQTLEEVYAKIQLILAGITVIT